MDNLKTFKDLYEALIGCSIDEFNILLSTPPRGKDIQESLLRLFAKLDCIEQLNEYEMCKGNFNLSTYTQIRSTHDIFYSDNKLICLKDSGDASDLTLLNEKINQVVAFTSKNVKKIQIPKLDIEKIISNHKSGNNLRIGICVRSSNDLQQSISAARRTTTENIKHLLSNALVIDHNDLRNSFSVFIDRYRDTSFNELILKSLKEDVKIIYRPHQLYTIEKSALYIRKWEASDKYVNILWGHIARSGKSYMMNGLIEKVDDHDDDDDSNYLIITTAPKETIGQYIQIMSVLKTRGYNIITDKKEITGLTGKNIIILSKQLLTNNSNADLSISSLKVIMIDEAHHGGTTDLTKGLLRKYPNCHKVFITATYEKVSYGFSIDKTLKWDLEDIELIKNHKYDQLEAKYPKFSVAVKNYELMNNDMPADYSKYPKLCLMGLDLNNQLRNEFNADEDNWTWSLNTLFEVKAKRLRNAYAVESIFRDIFHNIVDKIEKINEETHQRRILNPNSPSVIMCFLPSNNINTLSQLVKSILNRIDDEFEVCVCNTTDTSLDIKSNIEQSLVTAGNKNKKAVIALTGTQGHLGITIEHCDLVLLMNNSHSMDFIYQSMFRCMTEADTKQNGYVIDFDIDRCIFNVAEYGKFISTKPITHKEAIEHVISNGIINLVFSEDFHFYDKTKMLENILARYQTSEMSNVEHYLKKLISYDVKLTTDQMEKIGSFLIKSSSAKIIVHDDNVENDTEKITSSSNSNSSSSTSTNEVSKENKQSYMSTLKHLIPILCILTINESNLVDFKSMIQHILLNKNMYNILQEQFKIWWKKEMTDEQFSYFTSLFSELGLDQNSEIDSIITIIKQLFVDSKNDRDLLSRHIDTYLIPAIEEKNTNAEVSTPYFLRKEMLDTFPPEFWLEPIKIFEPCCGKAGFLIDIINRLLEAGFDMKTIIEERVYFADINPLNIFIACLLINPDGKYKVNAFVGDTLKMKFDFKFDAVIGNPPYQAPSSTAKSSGTCLWHKFVIRSLNEWIDNDGYLCFVHPAGWRKVSWDRSAFHGLFQLMAKDNTMLRLVIRDTIAGEQAFNCGTRYDYYLIKRMNNQNHLTDINDERFQDNQVNLNEMDMLNNFNFKELARLLAQPDDEKLRAVKNSSYHSTTNKFVSKNKDDEHQYTLIHSITKKGVIYRYSSVNDRGHFGVSKVIISDSGIPDVIIDFDGLYGLTEHCIYIEIDSYSEGEQIRTALLTDRFQTILKSCSWSNFQIEWRLFTHFKKDFYKELA